MEDGLIRDRSYILFCLIAVVLGLLPAASGAQEQSANLRLLAAGRSGDQAGITRALAEGASPDARTRIGETVLLISLKNDRSELARQMIAAGADINLAAANGVTPLMAAAHAGNTELARLLLERGADVNATDRLTKNAM